MTGFLGDSLKKHHLFKKKSQPEDILVEVFSSYFPDIERKHIRYTQGVVYLSGISLHAKTSLLLSKQRIIEDVKKFELILRDIL